MRVNGEWLICEDGVIRPVVLGLVSAANAQMINVPFLVDAGADRTVFSARFLHLFQGLESDSSNQINLAGVGGVVNSITIETVIALIRDDQRRVNVRGAFAVFTDRESAEMSVLGRDVTNNFSVICDYPNQAVALLASPHYYEIKRT